MLSLESSSVALQISEDAARIVFFDRGRGCSWKLDGGRGYRLPETMGELQPLGPGQARYDGPVAIRIVYNTPHGEIGYVWRLQGNSAMVTLETHVQGVSAISLPGAFRAERGVQQIAVPAYQGMLIRQRGESWQNRQIHSGHGGFTLSMAGAIADRGSLLVAHQSPANWHSVIGEDEAGPMFWFEHGPCPVEGWVDAVVQLTPTDPGVTPLCRQYRADLKARGLFVSWEEKIARKPILRELFGSLMAFLGYNKTGEVDYAASARQLHARGFDSVFYYPVRMLQYSLNFKMGGDDPVWLSDAEIAAIKAVPGAHVGPWGWGFEGLDDGTEARRHIFKHQADGTPIPNWKIDNFQWYMVCTPYQIEHMKQRFATDMKAADWVHYDVNAMFPGRCCFNRAHELHGNQPLSRRADMEWVRRLFSESTVGNRIVSSEGFGEHYAPWYDIGSTKFIPSGESLRYCTPVPMTMLVLHDSCLNDWWEEDNYNPHPGYPHVSLHHGLGLRGSGSDRLKAALDALYGCPPNVFTFGKQYGWSNFEKRESYSYVIRLDDPEVDRALEAALPVARLHRRIGMCDMTSMELLSDDGAVQATTFSDGTRVVANISEESHEAPGLGQMPGWSWREMR